MLGWYKVQNMWLCHENGYSRICEIIIPFHFSQKVLVHNKHHNHSLDK